MTTGAVSSTIVPQGRGGHAISISPGVGTTSAFNKGDSPSFSDLIDIINPLQHIPVVNTLYRAITGDHESAFADVIGGTLYGGPVGAGLAIADLGMRDATGKTVGEHAVAWLGIGGKDEPKANDTAVASASQPGAQVAAAATMPTKTLMVSPSVKQPGTATPTAAKKSADAGSGPILTPASLIANETVRPASTAKAGTATPAIVPTVSPYAAAPAATSEETGPATQNGYLVFGGTGSGQSAASAAPANAAPVASAATPAGGKTFASLGTGATPSAILPPAATPVSAQATALNGPQPKVFRVPPRNGPAAPPQTLPPPTTGPGALPGGKSLALSAQEAQQAAVQQDPQHNFLTAYTQALDKYRNAQRLASQTPAVSDAGAPTTLLQPASAVAPVEATDEGAGVTLH